MQRALRPSALVPRGFDVESAFWRYNRDHRTCYEQDESLSRRSMRRRTPANPALESASAAEQN